MPDRYTLATESDLLEVRFRVTLPTAYRKRYNVAPAQLMPVITSQAREGVSWFYWGTIPGWTGGNKAISSRILHVQASDLIGKSSFRRMLTSQRCVIPADGFYLWKRVGKKSLIPHRFVLRDRSPFGFAGIWEEFEDEQDNMNHVFRIVGTQMPDSLESFDGFMPVILDHDGTEVWLGKNSGEKELFKVLEPFPAGKLDHYTVSAKIEDVTFDHPSLLNPVASMNQYGNYSLFD